MFRLKLAIWIILSGKKGFCFNNQPIHVIIDKLRLYYDVRIEVADLPFLEERYSGKFRVKEGIEQVLKVLQLEHKFTYVKDNELNLITIK